jgi:uncharacterized protein (TIGR03067 family)
MSISTIATILLLAPVPELPLIPALKELQGKWRAISVEEKGDAWENKEEIDGVLIDIKGDMLTYKRNTPIEKFRITLDTDKKPARMDLRLVAENVDPAKACHAIYELKDGKLKLCLYSEFTAKDASDRPGRFETGGMRPPQGKFLIVMERINKPAEKK